MLQIAADSTIRGQPVIVESDSLEPVKVCNREVDLWLPVLSDCFQIAQRIGRVSFIHCHREANKVAHNLARLSYSSDSIFLWEGDPPLSVLRDVIDDVTVF
jgi:hypothetical protein